jgi:hypothetical protein
MVPLTHASTALRLTLVSMLFQLSLVQVMLTEKVVFCIVMVPTLWIGYACLLYFFTGLDVAAIALVIMTMPLFA